MNTPDNEPYKIYICNGSDCTRRGTQGALWREIEKHFAPHEIGQMNCLGLCHKGSAFRYQGRNYSLPRATDIAQLLQHKEA